MHVLFIHPNFPAQFGHIATHLTTQLGWTCTYLTSIDTSHLQLPFNHLNYNVKSGAQPTVYYNPENLVESLEHLKAVYAGMRGLPQFRPDLVVGHMSYGTMLYLRNLYPCPFIGYFELLPAPFWTDRTIKRKEFPPTEAVRLATSTYHALTYLHLHSVDACYTPTYYQLNTCPPEMRYKVRVIHDGIDTELFQPRSLSKPTHFRGLTINPGTRIVTFVSRGLESTRGFDIFMKVAKKIYQQMDNVLFLVAGAELSTYGIEKIYIGSQSFKQWALSQDNYDLSRIRFLDVIPLAELATLYNLSDLHIYLTVPYILSWSLVQAMASSCTILGSATAPVQEVIDDGVHGLLADFYDVDGLTERALQVLRDPEQFRHLGANARARVLERYEEKKCIHELVQFFQEVTTRPGQPAGG